MSHQGRRKSRKAFLLPYHVHGNVEVVCGGLHYLFRIFTVFSNSHCSRVAFLWEKYSSHDTSIRLGLMTSCDQRTMSRSDALSSKAEAFGADAWFCHCSSFSDKRGTFQTGLLFHHRPKMKKEWRVDQYSMFNMRKNKLCFWKLMRFGDFLLATV